MLLKLKLKIKLNKIESKKVEYAYKCVCVCVCTRVVRVYFLIKIDTHFQRKIFFYIYPYF